MTRPYTIYNKATLEPTRTGVCPNAAYGLQLKDPDLYDIAPVHCDPETEKIVIKDGKPKKAKRTKADIAKRIKAKEDHIKKQNDDDPDRVIKVKKSEWDSILARLAALES